ncbi:U3 small nucleolar RNA-associated protein 14 homolog A [Nelusetta ayraudi]|uniref:U3 small nucleolar RNA-associated protein 14 homolog A n=1 Tax=Nelusetta ayraudi TaxID=303726 RepID=UPI003F702B3F
MAKASKKKLSKKSVKKRPVVAREEPEVAFDDDDEDEEEQQQEDMASEEEQQEEEQRDAGDERRRLKLLEAIGSLGGRQRRSLPGGERSEAAVDMSEFSVAAEGQGERLELSELIGTMERTPAVSSRSSKQLKLLQQARRTAESPLSRQQGERVRRAAAFQKASAEVSRWKGAIRQQQRAEQLVFPLQQEPAGPRAVHALACGWKAQTPLEQEIFSLLRANKQPVHEPVLTPGEEASLRAMSLEEAQVRRAELQKMRALQSYYEAKARRERRIKSKKYHKVHNKAKRKEALKRFEEAARTDPAAALEELRKVEVARMQERMTLKHQNSGKWAKSKAIMAKYDQEARKAMQEQLEVHKELTMKVAKQLDQEEEEEDVGEEEVLPDFVNDAEGGGDPSNPWMRGKLSEEEKRSDAAALSAGEEVEKTAEEVEEEEEEQVEETEEEVLLKEFESRRKFRQDQEAAAGAVEEEEQEEVVMDKEEEEVVMDKEEEELSEFTNLFRELADGGQEGVPATNTGALLEEDLRRVRTLEEVELLSQEEESTPPPPPPAAAAGPTEPKSSRKKRKRKVELKEVLTKGTKEVQVALAPTVEDGEAWEEQPDQRTLIREAFAGDDVVSDFLKDKKVQEDRAKPKEVDLVLPGWGQWGGTGLKPSRAKRRRFGAKQTLTPPPARRDQSLPGVIIWEKRNAAVGLHQVASLPFPFQNQQQFQSTIRTPLGRTWNTEGTVKKVTRPRVVTRLGTIIPPMDQQQLLEDKKNSEVLQRKKP